MKTFILGGARSGKSRLAEEVAEKSQRSVIYIATGEARDEEMHARIVQHQARRPAHWGLIEEPVHLGMALEKHDSPSGLLLVDCLTLWLANVLQNTDADFFVSERAHFFASLTKLKGHIVLVSNEVGQGIVPLGESTRRFRDEAGRLNQEVARHCQRVILAVAGLPLFLKGSV